MRLRRRFPWLDRPTQPTAPAAEERRPAPTEVFVARRPVFTRSLCVEAYELLFRPSRVDSPSTDPYPGLASSRVIGLGLGTLGWDPLTGERRAFVTVSRELLLGDRLQLLPVDTTIVGVHDDTVDAELLDACARLRWAGYDLAVDARLVRTANAALLDVARFVRLDLSADGYGQTDVARLRARDLKIVATNVETREQFARAKALGCTHFQGFFFRKPAVVAGRETAGFGGNHQQLLAEATRPEVDCRRLEEVIQQDLSLSYTFLWFMNSAAFGWSRKITAPRQALVLLGQEQLRRWVSLTAVVSAVEGKPRELAVDAVVRARFCESLADLRHLAGSRLDLFMLGLLSTIDAVLDLPVGEAVARVPTSDDVRAALLGRPGTLRDVLDLVNAYCRGNWAGVAEAAVRLGIAEGELPERYASALAWADEVFRTGTDLAG